MTGAAADVAAAPVQGQEKMSKSDPNSAIFMEDSKEDVDRKIKKAFCPPNVVQGNPCLKYIQLIILPWSGSFTVIFSKDGGHEKCAATQNRTCTEVLSLPITVKCSTSAMICTCDRSAWQHTAAEVALHSMTRSLTLISETDRDEAWPAGCTRRQMSSTRTLRAEWSTPVTLNQRCRQPSMPFCSL